MTWVSEPITPELALVCPELRRAAIAADAWRDSLAQAHAGIAVAVTQTTVTPVPTARSSLIQFVGLNLLFIFLVIWTTAVLTAVADLIR